MSNAGDADEGTGQVLLTHMPRPVCLGSKLFSTVFDGAREDLRRPMLSHMTFIASDAHKLFEASGAPRLAETITVVAKPVLGKSCACVFLMVTEVTFHFAHRFFSPSHHLFATTFGMSSGSDLSLEFFVTFQASVEPAFNTFGALNLSNKLLLNVHILLFFTLKP